MKKIAAKILSVVLCLNAMSSLSACFLFPSGNSSNSTDTGSASTDTASPEEPDLTMEDVVIDTMTSASFINSYNANTSADVEEEKKFWITGTERNSYKVGDDNPFKFMPKVTYLDKETEEEIDEIPVDADFSYDLQVKDNEGNFVKADDTYLDMATTKTNTCEFDFATKAIGKTFKLSVTPNGLTETQKADSQFTQTFEFDVIDGYNAYNDYDLAYISNYSEVNGLNENSIPTGTDSANSVNNQAGWIKFRNKHGLTLNPNDIKAVILHSDITLTKDSIPDNMLYKKDEGPYDYLVGTLKDEVSSGIYYRHMTPNSEFSFIGNYFTVDASRMPYVLQMASGFDTSVEFDKDGNITSSSVISHATLFRIDGRDIGNNKGSNKSNAKSYIVDMNVIGNSPKTEDKIVQGGLILMKAEKVFCEMNNIISHSFFITAMGQTDDTTCNFYNFKCYDSFNSPIYNWGCDDMNLNNCIIENAGGPAIICDAIKTSDGSENNEPRIITPVVVGTNCIFDNPVTGFEAWFAMANATGLIPDILTLDTLYTSQGGLNDQVNGMLSQLGQPTIPGRTFLKTIGANQMFNAWCVVKNDENTLGTDMSAYININGSVLDYGNSENTIENLKTTLSVAGALGSNEILAAAPVITTSGGGLVYIGGDYQPVFPNGTNSALYMLQGDVMNLYKNTGSMNGMLGVMFELYEAE